MQSEHPTCLGEIPKVEKNTTVYFKEKRTILTLYHNSKNKMTRKPATTSGLYLGILFAVIMFSRKKAPSQSCSIFLMSSIENTT